MTSVNSTSLEQSQIERGRRYRAVWSGAILAESAMTVVVEGNHYFPLEDTHREYFRASQTHTTCHWKGIASYYDIVVGDGINRDAAWYYADPSRPAERIRGRVAFWRGVTVEAVPD